MTREQVPRRERARAIGSAAKRTLPGGPAHFRLVVPKGGLKGYESH